jgi:hypothetical protein
LRLDDLLAGCARRRGALCPGPSAASSADVPFHRTAHDDGADRGRDHNPQMARPPLLLALSFRLCVRPIRASGDPKRRRRISLSRRRYTRAGAEAALAETPAMVRFLSAKAGFGLPANKYTQLLAPGGGGAGRRDLLADRMGGARTLQRRSAIGLGNRPRARPSMVGQFRHQRQLEGLLVERRHHHLHDRGLEGAPLRPAGLGSGTGRRPRPDWHGQARRDGTGRSPSAVSILLSASGALSNTARAPFSCTSSRKILGERPFLGRAQGLYETPCRRHRHQHGSPACDGTRERAKLVRRVRRVGVRLRSGN